VGPAAATLEPADTAAPKLTTVYNPGEALAQCWNSQELLREMIQHFFRESDSLLGRMRAALEQDDLAKVGELGHRLKGTILYLGAQPAEQAVRRVERFYNAYCGNRSEAVQAINTLQQECTLLKAAIAEHPLAVESRQSD
jgi:HPt (histidine-containing phosphotransfer) domain-containing protein